MVEQSLLERFASPLPSIGDFFRGVPRESAVRCTSSITFSYRPATQPINPRLLAEKDREEIAKEEAESRRDAIALAKTEADGTVLSLGTSSPAGSSFLATEGHLMFGAGVNSDAGLVGNITLDEQNAAENVQLAGCGHCGSAAGNGPVRGFQTTGRNYNRQRRPQSGSVRIGPAGKASSEPWSKRIFAIVFVQIEQAATMEPAARKLRTKAVYPGADPLSISLPGGPAARRQSTMPAVRISRPATSTA